MNYYVIQVRTGGESKYISLARRAILTTPDSGLSPDSLLWPRRKLRIRKRGVEREKDAPIFPGYVFLEAEELDGDAYWLLRRTPGFYRYLKDNQNVEPLRGSDRSTLMHFLSFGEVVQKSKVYFDENKRIRVIHGALKGLEGRIVKVDRRKKRARVQLSLYEDSFHIDFGFEVLEPMDRNGEQKT